MEGAYYDSIAGLTAMATRNAATMARSCESDSSKCSKNQNTLESHLGLLGVSNTLSEKPHRGKRTRVRV